MRAADSTRRHGRLSRIGRIGNRRRLAALSGAAALVLAAAACSTSGSSSSSATGTTSPGTSGQSLTTINIGEVPFYANIPLALGEKVGIFAHYGLQVNLQPASNVNVIIANLHSGHQQLGFVTTPLLLKADEAGQGVECVAPLGVANNVNPSYPENAVMVAKGSSITSLAQLSGKTVGLNELEGSNELYLEAGVEAAGGNFASVKLATIPFADMAAALKSGTIQAGFEVEPFIVSGEQSGDQKMLADLDSVTSPWTTQCYAATNSYLTANTAVMTRFVEAEDQSILYAAAHPSEALAEIGTVSGLSAAAAKADVPPDIVYTDSLAPSSLISYADLMLKYNDLKSPVPAQSAIAWVAPGSPATKLLFADGGKYTG
jgi:NitT/TauT family transport system substrate-binding protein